MPERKKDAGVLAELQRTLHEQARLRRGRLLCPSVVILDLTSRSSTSGIKMPETAITSPPARCFDPRRQAPWQKYPAFRKRVRVGAKTASRVAAAHHQLSMRRMAARSMKASEVWTNSLKECKSVQIRSSQRTDTTTPISTTPPGPGSPRTFRFWLALDLNATCSWTPWG